MKKVKYLTVFLGDEAMAVEARRLVDGQLSNGWEISETISLGIGNSQDTNRPQIQLLHVLLKEVDVPAAKAKVGRPAKKD